jgi:hypothetical protein
VQDAVLEGQKNCEPATVALKPGFITQKDINADGANDYILDYRKFVCGSDRSYFCGTAGCLTQVFVSLPDGTFTKVLDENVRDIRFALVKGRPARTEPIDDLRGELDADMMALSPKRPPGSRKTSAPPSGSAWRW